MYFGFFASSPSAFRSSWMQVTSASSPTTVPRHTSRNSSSLLTGSPARAMSRARARAAVGVSLISRLPDQRRADPGSKRKRAKVSDAFMSRPNPGTLPGLEPCPMRRLFAMKRTVIFLYGVASYLVFFATFLYAVGFIGNVWVPKSLDSPRDVGLGHALAIDLGLLALFAVQHSVMARPAFKRWWTRIVPEPAERSTYVLFSSLALILLFLLWQPMGGAVWQVSNPLGRTVLHALCAFGWG